MLQPRRSGSLCVDEIIRAMRIQIDLSGVDSEAERSFETYRNYLLHLEIWLIDTFGARDIRDASLVAAVRGAPGFHRIQRRQLDAAQRANLQRSLEICWVEELQLIQPESVPDEVIAAVIHGSAHAAYYAVLHAALAYFAASGQAPRPTHAAALTTLSDLVTTRRLLPMPWACHCDGGPKRVEMRWNGDPMRSAPAGFNLRVASRSQCEHSLCLALATTRDHQINERKEDWRRTNKRSRVPAAAVAKIAQGTGSTTIFDLLWRLRTRSDYRDAGIFLTGVTEPWEARAYHRAMCSVACGTIALLEALTLAYGGREVYEAAYSRLNVQFRTESLERRASALLK